MKFNRFSWENYLQTERGEQAIRDFSLEGDDASEVIVSFKYNSHLKQLCDNAKSKEFITTLLDDLWDGVFVDQTPPQDDYEASKIYEDLLSSGLCGYIGEDDYQTCLQVNLWLSWLLYQLAPDYFFPNLFQFQAKNLYKIADVFGIDLPIIPKKADYKARCMYYWELCKVFCKFRIENGLTSQELCAFLYDFAPNFTPSDVMEMPQPSQVWMIGGKIEDIDHTDEELVFWQCNQETKKGDILVHYETSPVSAITRVWQAATDGMIDPFFHYYGCTYITNRIDIPHITLAELKSDSYFSTHPLMRKNFQGVNGWPLSASDYDHILGILEWKGTDISKLPKLYSPTIETRDDIKIEEDVEKLLLEPILEEMGFSDYKRRLPVKAGRGHRIIADYVLHYCDKHNEESAKVLIEAKYHMKNPQEREAAFLQARSYARLLSSSLIVLCDKESLFVYEREFDRQNYTLFKWNELKDTDKFIKLKRLLE